MAMNDEKNTGSQRNPDSGPESGPESGPNSVAPLARHFLWVDRADGVDRFIRGLTYVCVVLFLFDIVWHRHTKVPGEGLWGFHAIAGYVAFTLIVIAARFLRIFIRRDETFYGDRCVDSESYPEADTARETHEDFHRDSLQDLGEQMLGRDSNERAVGRGGASS